MNKKLQISTRLIIVVCSLLIILAFFFPLWDISLAAPQYPEGLSLQIWINKITGQVDIINGLNHYIGMKYIKEEMFPELKYMPYIVGGIIGLGLLTAAIGRKYMLVIFALIIVAAGIAGAVDFYLWSYDYGHNLDPRAPIKVPGMSYQPPMFGSKDLLNFTATSWPAIGGIAIMVAALASVILSIYELRKK